MRKVRPEDRREKIRDFALDACTFLTEQANEAMASVHAAEERLAACLVPAPGKRTATSAVLHHLALADSSLSAQQLCESVDDSVRPAVQPLREFLHANKPDMFYEARRGSFLLGSRYSVRSSAV